MQADPTSTPVADRVEANVELASNLTVMLAFCSREDDACSQGLLLGSTVAMYQLLSVGALDIASSVTGSGLGPRIEEVLSHVFLRSHYTTELFGPQCTRNLSGQNSFQVST